MEDEVDRHTKAVVDKSKVRGITDIATTVLDPPEVGGIKAALETTKGRLKRCHVITRLRGETRRDHRGLVPKSKRERGKRENRLRANKDTQGHGPPTQKMRVGHQHREMRTSKCIY